GILDEIKKAIDSAKSAKVCGRVLDKLFGSTIRIATRIREASEIGKDILSIGDIAVKTAEEKTGLDGKHVLLLGTGESAAMVAKALKKKNIEFDVSSRTIERSTSFSKLLGGKPVDFEQVLSGFDKFDIIFVATTADYFFINYDRIKLVMESKKKGTMIMDVSEPRAVDENVAYLPGTKLMFRDQVSELVEENERFRRKKVPEVEEMISKEVPIIDATMNRLDAEPIVVDVASSIDTLRKQELEKALEKLGETDEEKIKILDELTKAVAKNIISVPASETEKSSEQEG
ncbi:MAG: glutamyl-tRNA reductase, partial [Candidatus Thorarchaeota archaeon]